MLGPIPIPLPIPRLSNTATWTCFGARILLEAPVFEPRNHSVKC